MTAPLYNLTDSWSADNSSAILMNVTTNAHTGDLLKLQSDGTTMVNIRPKDAFFGGAYPQITFGDQSASSAGSLIVQGTTFHFGSGDTGYSSVVVAGSLGATGLPGVNVTSAGSYGWGGTNAYTGLDTNISRSAAGVVQFGTTTLNANGTIKAKTKAGAPSTSDVPDGTWVLIRDTSNTTTKLYYNNGGALQSVALT
jgi:hypothetical protein